MLIVAGALLVQGSMPVLISRHFAQVKRSSNLYCAWRTSERIESSAPSTLASGGSQMAPPEGKVWWTPNQLRVQCLGTAIWNGDRGLGKFIFESEWKPLAKEDPHFSHPVVRWICIEPSPSELKDSIWSEADRSLGKAGRFSAVVLQIGHPEVPFAKQEVAWLFDPKTAQLARLQIRSEYDATIATTDFELKELRFDAVFGANTFRVDNPVEEIARPNGRA